MILSIDSRGRGALLSSVAIVAMTVGADAQDRGQDRDGVYQLGEIYVSGGGRSGSGGGGGVGGSTVTREQMWTFEKQTLDQAVNLVPGVNGTQSSAGQRNETDIFVRGFGRWQVPLMIDGVRVYLPADNRLDFSRFLTGDISEIQIQKGYASVLDGPGGMGGAINLVSLKPVKPFESELRAGTMFDNRGAFQGWNSYARIGSRQENFYVQGSVNQLDQNFWSLYRAAIRHIRRKVLTPARWRMADGATDQTPRTGESTSRLVTRPTPPTNTASTIPSSPAPRVHP